MVENINTNNVETKKNILTDKQRPYDPILDDPISSGESQDDKNNSSEESGSGSEDEVEIEFPRQNANDLLNFIHRELTNLSNMEDAQKRKFALLRMYEIFVLAKTKASKKVYQELLPNIQKPLLKRLADKVEKSRELAALIIKEFVTQVDDISLTLPYLIPVLVDRLNADDLEGLDSLPDFMKPRPEQRALVHSHLNEPSEEIRMLLAEIFTLIVNSTDWICLRPYVDQLVAIARALCIDPSGIVIQEGTLGMQGLAKQGQDQLIHFCEAMGRALFTSFVHKHAKVRVAGLDALFDVMVCGQWKTSVEILQHMVGFRDPNIVAIKEFYEPSAKVNYFAMFVADRSTVVREKFYKTIGDMLLRLPDKVDHEGRLFPYMISGLYDPNDGIQQTCFEIIEELGQRYEEENEEKLREVKQFGFQNEWTFNGKVKDNKIILPFPVAHRPRLGARWLVRQYVRRYITALYKEISDWRVESRERASYLIVFSIIYSEDYMVQFLDNLLVSLYRVILEKENKVVQKNVPLCLRLLGRYCMPNHYQTLIMSALKNELASFYSYTQTGATRAFGYLFEGAVELIYEADQFSKVQPILEEFIFVANKVLCEGMDMELAELLCQTINQILRNLLEKKNQGINPQVLIEQQLYTLFLITMKCLAVFQNFRLQSKPDPDSVIESKRVAHEIFDQLYQLYSDNQSVPDYITVGLPNVFEEIFGLCHEQVVSCWALQQPQFRLFFASTTIVTENHLKLEVTSGITIFDELCRLLRGVLCNSEESKNYKVKHLAIYTVFPMLVNRVQNFIGPNESDLLMGILEQAFHIDWGSQQEDEKHIISLANQHIELIKSQSIRLKSFDSLEQFTKLVKTLQKVYKPKNNDEKLIKLGLSSLRSYLEIFYNQLVEPIKDTEDRFNLISKTDFLSSLTDDVIPMCGSYFDGVRDQACQILEYVSNKFLNFEPQLSQQQQEVLQMLRANLQIGWNKEMSAPVKGIAEMENELVKFMFVDAQKALSKVITIMLDEPSTREVLSRFVVQINRSLPFLLLNDYRISYATNSLQRIEVLKRILTSTNQ